MRCQPVPLDECCSKDEQGSRFINLEQVVLFFVFQVADDEVLQEQIGSDVFFDLVDFEKVRTFRVPRQNKFVQFKVSAVVVVANALRRWLP